MTTASKIGLLILLVGARAAAQDAAPEFKLGTFQRQNQTFVGIVLPNSTVIDFAAAHAAVRNPASSVAAPTDMKDLIARYDSGLKARIVEIVRSVGTASAAARPAYVHDLSSLKILPPIIYPTTMLNVAVNYREHDIEMARVRPGRTPRARRRPGPRCRERRARPASGSARRTTRAGIRTCS